jgi:hypothetical protein
VNRLRIADFPNGAGQQAFAFGGVVGLKKVDASNPQSRTEAVMSKVNTRNWRLDRRVNLSVLLQLMVLASMILASWVNLQRQLDLLQHDVRMLL